MMTENFYRVESFVDFIDLQYKDFIFIEYIYRGGRLELIWPEPSFSRIGSIEMTLLISTIKAL